MARDLFPGMKLRGRSAPLAQEDSDTDLPTWVFVVGVIASIVTSLQFGGQAFNLWFVEHAASPLTWTTLSACFVGQSLWAAYGAAAGNAIVFVSAVVSGSLYVALAGTKLWFPRAESGG